MGMATGKITISALNGLDGWLWCSSCTGFGARKQRRGIFFYCRYRHQGRQVMHSIGKFGSPWTVETARNEAKRLLGIVVTGVDPCAQSLSAETFGTEVERYLLRKQTSLKPRSFVEAQRNLQKHSVPLHKLPLGDIDRRTIAVLLGQVETASGPIARNRLRSSLSAFFAWAIQEGLTETNPVQGTGKADEGDSRDRVLTQEELRKLWHGLSDGPFSEIVRLLLLTGQRRNEIGRLQWSEIDLPRKLIVLAPDRTKNGRRHEVPLSTQALAVIERTPRRNSSGFLFSEKGAFGNWSKAKAELDQRIQIIQSWRLHDLRRSAASYMGEIGVQPHHIEAILNHYSGHRAGVAGVYQRAKYEPEMRAALQKWADYVEKITQ
jgi:integrase